MSNAARADEVTFEWTNAHSRYLRAAFLLLFIVIGIAAPWLRTTYVMTGDTSWLLTLGERYLAGDRLYSDLLEVNPPASIFLYLPAVILAKYLPLSAETIVTCLVFFAMFASLATSFALLQISREGRASLNLPMLAVALFLLAIFPGETFTQREHIATMLILPWLSLALLRLEGANAPLSLSFLTGVLGGIVFCIKPVFVAPMALVFALVMWRKPSLDYVLAPEHLLGGVIALTYTAITFIAFPDFWNVMFPLLKAVYLKQTSYFPGLLMFMPWFLMILIILMLRAKEVWNEAAGVLICASTGFALASLWQAKFFTYHFYPMMVLIVLACVSASMAAAQQVYRENNAAPPFRAVLRCYYPAIVALAALARFWALYWSQQDFRPLLEAVRRAAPAPVIINMTQHIYTGHPVARMAGGKWAGRLPTTWLLHDVEALRASGVSGPAEEKGFAEALQLNLGSFRSDFRTKAPNVVIISPADLAWARKDPELAGYLSNFEITAAMPLEWLAITVHVMARRKPAAD